MKRDAVLAPASDDEVGPAQLSRQLFKLRFEAPLEAAFRSHYEGGAPAARLTLHLLAIVLIGITPLYDERLLSAPASFVRIERLLDFGVEIPAILLAMLTTVVARLRRFSALVTMIVGLLVACCFMAQRLYGMPHGFHVPHDLPVLALAATLVLARLRVRGFLPWASLTLAGITTVELRYFPSAAAWYDAISSWMLFLIAAIAAWLIERSARESWYRGRLLEQLALRDALTGLANRRHFDEELARLIAAAQRDHRPMALMVFDIDHFKSYNDQYGHPAGDDCLRRIGAYLAAVQQRPLDFCARIGGEEFAAVWYDIAEPDAARLAEALRVGIEQLGVETAESPGVVTASGGLSVLPPPTPGASVTALAAQLLKGADSALYQAKRAGRRRLEMQAARRD